jgi:Ni/Co efflux regulator RcnB
MRNGGVLTMRSLIIAGIGASFYSFMTPAVASGETGARPVPAHNVAAASPAMHRWGPRLDGRWRAGHDAPGGWAEYRRPAYGFALPRYWVQPGFYIANYAAYGLPAPGYGYGWSRYYDDAVLTDQYGRVYDSRSGIQWDRYEGGYDAESSGKPFDDAEAHHPRPPEGPPPGHRPMPYDDTVTSSNEYPGQAEYRGQWRGTWRGDDGRVYGGTYEGTYNGTADAGPPPPHGGPHWTNGSGYEYPPGATVYYAAPGTTIVIQPGTTTTTTTVEEDVVPARRTSRTYHSKIIRCRC